MILTDWVKDNCLDAAEPPFVVLRKFPSKHSKVVEQWLPWIELVVEVYTNFRIKMWLPRKCFGKKAIYSLLKTAGVTAPSDYYTIVYKCKDQIGRIRNVGPKDNGSDQDR